MIKNKFGTMIENKKTIRGFGTLSTSKKKELFLVVFEKKQTNISAACKAVPIDRKTFYAWMKSDEDFKGKIVAIEEGLIDWAESELRKSMKAGQYVPTIFFLKTKGKKRGYIEKTEHEHSGAIKFEASNEFLPKPNKEDQVIPSVVEEVDIEEEPKP